jgi:hypothetical protein
MRRTVGNALRSRLRTRSGGRRNDLLRGAYPADPRGQEDPDEATPHLRPQGGPTLPHPEEDAKKEGGYTFEEFRHVWEEINGFWDPDEVVTVYEFKLVSPPSLSQSRLQNTKIFLFVTANA